MYYVWQCEISIQLICFEMFLDIVTRSVVTWKPLTRTRVERSLRVSVFKACAGRSHAVKNKNSDSPGVA